MNGLGIVIGDDILCADALKCGDLTKVGDTLRPGRDDYWLSAHPDMRGDRIADKFGAWLFSELADVTGNRAT
ncbi:hypothetical protein [Roseobacter sp. MH60115]|uniref:hypothetical protein n=1 Tax=Roseobacter sp. MH60115 TaxID=2785324 RepID=UPI0018A26315|nr:hypothetical protein [Roseobacter sp. MH60115]